jgi:hypothetical protein
MMFTRARCESGPETLFPVGLHKTNDRFMFQCTQSQKPKRLIQLRNDLANVLLCAVIDVKNEEECIYGFGMFEMFG